MKKILIIWLTFISIAGFAQEFDYYLGKFDFVSKYMDGNLVSEFDSTEAIFSFDAQLRNDSMVGLSGVFFCLLDSNDCEFLFNKRVRIFTEDSNPFTYVGKIIEVNDYFCKYPSTFWVKKFKYGKKSGKIILIYSKVSEKFYLYTVVVSVKKKMIEYFKKGRL